MELKLPDLDLGDQPVVLSVWLVKEGARVVEGEPLAEVWAGDVTVDLPSPAAGVLVKKQAAEGDVLTVGASLAEVATAF